MRAVIQRVSSAKVEISALVKSEIQEGLLVLIGIEDSDGLDDIDWLCSKIVNLRVFPDANGVMNLSSIDKGTQILIVSQFTLHASTKKGNRPSYIKAAKPETAIPLYNKFIEKMEQHLPGKIGTGEFGADMQISLLNNGPVTIIIDTKNKE